MADMKAFERECTAHFAALWGTEATSLVFGEGNCQSPAIMLIGEAPGAQETLQRRPFVGTAGKNLNAFLEAMQLTRAEMFVTNTVKIRPTAVGSSGRLRNRAPGRQEIAAFLPWLLREIELISPKVLVTLGNVPLQALTNGKVNIGAVHGTWQRAVNGTPLFALYHPAAVIYRRELKEVYANDVRTLRDAMTFETRNCGFKAESLSF